MKNIPAIILFSLIFINACSGSSSNGPRVVTIADLDGNPDGVTVADSGNIYVTDIVSGEVIQITPGGGATVIADLDSTADNTHPDGITSVTGGSGNEILYVTTTGSSDPEGGTLSTDGTVQKIDTTTGTVTEFVGSTTLDNPTGIAADESGNLYVADQGTGNIYKIPVDSSGNPGSIINLTTTLPAGVDIEEPHGLTLVTNSDGSITLYTTDEGDSSNNIVKIDITSATNSTVTGIIEYTPDSTGGTTTDTTTANAKFNKPHGITTNGNGAIFVADENNNRVQIITPGGNVVTFAGTGIAGDSDGDPDNAQFNKPRGMAVDSDGGVLVCDYGNGKVKKIIN
ncbi:MAG TPA: NHL repeat-containing protein [Spirochaetota bacterium]|nr:NHL repeat-containing protein [Spirochaetota bacterium]HPJ44328.1 NHL repeat-containing protein [Spirochaetota bacterium]HPR37824.1 NHL repeat-containing protein [Spirochaetota bacterium]